jgi:hypothetical protein
VIWELVFLGFFIERLEDDLTQDFIRETIPKGRFKGKLTVIARTGTDFTVGSQAHAVAGFAEMEMVMALMKPAIAPACLRR